MVLHNLFGRTIAFADGNLDTVITFTRQFAHRDQEGMNIMMNTALADILGKFKYYCMRLEGAACLSFLILTEVQDTGTSFCRPALRVSLTWPFQNSSPRPSSGFPLLPEPVLRRLY